MSKIKKMTAVLLSVVMFVCCFMITAGAVSIEDTAKAISSGQSCSTTLYNKGDYADYKVTAKKEGYLVIKLTSKMERVNLFVFDPYGNNMEYSNKDVSSGDASFSWYYNYSTSCYWNENVEKFNGTLTYAIKKGTYYIRLYRDSNNGNGKVSFTATFPSSSSSSSKVNYITIPMRAGNKIQLSTDAGTSGITWSSSKSSVAAVSSTGKVTAKKAGTTVITAKSGSSTARIQIKVS